MNDKQIIQEFHQWAAANGLTPHSTVGNESVDLVANWFIEKFSLYKSEVGKMVKGLKEIVEPKSDVVFISGYNCALEDVLINLRSDN